MLTRDSSMSSQKEKVQKYAGFIDVGAHAAQSSHSVCLIRVFFVHFVYLLGRFSEVNIGFQPPPTLQTRIIHHPVFCFVFPMCRILCHDFLLFLCYCIIFLHTYSYKHVHMFCFFKLPHFCLCFPFFIIIIWDGNRSTSESWSLVYYQKGRYFSTAHSSLMLCCPLCTLIFFFSPLFVMGALF